MVEYVTKHGEKHGLRDTVLFHAIDMTALAGCRVALVTGEKSGEFRAHRPAESCVSSFDKASAHDTQLSRPGRSHE